MPIMLVNKHIGYDDKNVAGILGDIFQKELFELSNMGKRVVEVWVNTPGGSVIEGYNIYSAITNMNQSGKMVVNTLNTGIAASTGGWIFQAGKKREMMDFSVLMMHNSFNSKDEESGNGDEEIDKSIATMLATKSGKTYNQVLEFMNKTTFMDAPECLKEGFCDSVRASGSVVSLPSLHSQTAIWNAGNTYINKLLVNQTDMSVSKINNILDLNDDASEASQVKAIQGIVNRATKAEKDLADYKNQQETEMNRMKQDLDKKANEYNALKDQYDAMKKEADDKAAQRNMEDCKNLIEGFVNKGFLKDEESVKTEWVNNALTLGLDKTKAMLESLPVNRIAPKPETVKTITTGKAPVNMAAAMNRMNTETKK